MKKLALIMAVLAVVAVGQVAQADFVAYNDCIDRDGTYDDPHANTTTYSDYGGTEATSGLLKSFATGLDTSVTATMSSVNISRGWAVAPVSGTDAYNVFKGKVGLGDASVSYNNSSLDWSYQVVFTGLDSSKTYEFVTTAHRKDALYDPERWTKFSIIGADTCTNGSSTGVVEISADVVRMNTGNNTAGRVVRWTGITSGTDGTFTVISQNVGTAGPGQANKSYGMEGFMLVEVPEPMTMCLLGLGGLGLLRRRRK